MRKPLFLFYSLFVLLFGPMLNPFFFLIAHLGHVGLSDGNQRIALGVKHTIIGLRSDERKKHHKRMKAIFQDYFGISV